jgi:hypothetical protein
MRAAETIDSYRRRPRVVPFSLSYEVAHAMPRRLVLESYRHLAF